MIVYFKENLGILYRIPKSKLNEYLYNKFGGFTDKLCYGIHNLIETDKWYIGSTLNGIYQRFWRCWDTAHFKLIEEGNNKFITEGSVDNFELVILYYDETNSISWSELRNIETKFIEKYDSYNKGYNNTPIAQAGFYGRKHSEDEIAKIKSTLSVTNSNPEVKERRSRSLSEKWKDPEYRKKKSGHKVYYSCLAKKLFHLKDSEIDDVKLMYPDLKMGNPITKSRSMREKNPNYKWWEDERFK